MSQHSKTAPTFDEEYGGGGEGGVVPGRAGAAAASALTAGAAASQAARAKTQKELGTSSQAVKPQVASTGQGQPHCCSITLSITLSITPLSMLLPEQLRQAILPDVIVVHTSVVCMYLRALALWLVFGLYPGHFCMLLSATTSTIHGLKTSSGPLQAVVHVES